MAAGTAKRTPAPRRSRLDIRFGRHLSIGQEWLRDHDETVWRMRQIHRADCTAELVRDRQVQLVPFSDLRAGWRRVIAIGRPGARSVTHRQDLDREMAAVLLELVTCSHVPAVNYGGTGASTDEHPGGRRPPGDVGADEYARLYGMPFHQCTRSCTHVRPAYDDRGREIVLAFARRVLKEIRGRGERTHEDGESQDMLIARGLKETAGLPAAAVGSTRFRWSATVTRRYRRLAGLDPETGTPFQTEPTMPVEERQRRARELEHEGFSISYIARKLGVHRNTVSADLRKDPAA